MMNKQITITTVHFRQTDNLCRTELIKHVYESNKYRY